MQALKHHQMRLQRTHASGAEEWYCPSCGRRFLMSWNPFEKTIIQAGDEHAWHTGDRSAPAQRAAPEALVSADDELLADGLRPWLKWFDSAGLDDHWTHGV